MCLKNVLDYFIKKDEIKRNHKNELELLKIQQNFERETILVAQRQKEVENINEYISVIKSILNGTYEYVRFNKVANIILSYFDDKELCTKIRELNKTIDDYFKQWDILTEYKSFSFNDSIQTQFAPIEEKLLNHIQDHNAYGIKTIEESNMSVKQIKKLKRKVKSRSKKEKPPKNGG